MITRPCTKLELEPDEEGGRSQDHAPNWNRNQGRGRMITRSRTKLGPEPEEEGG